MMAGVAPQRGGSNVTTIGMVVSILVAVILLGVLIFLFTNQEQLRTNARNATESLSRIAPASDRSSAQQMFPDSNGAGKSLVGEMNKGISLLAGRLTGNTTDTPTVATTKLDTVLTEIAEAKKVPNPEQVCP